MPIPSFQNILLPLLSHTKDKGVVKLNDVIEELGDYFELTEEEKKQLLPSGNAVIFKNRVRFARLYLIKAGLLESPKRGYVEISSTGEETLKENLDRIDLKYLERFPQYKEFKKKLKQTQKDKRKEKTESSSQRVDDEMEGQTTEENFEYAYEKLKEETAIELREKIEGSTWSFFENLVIDLLLRMGYGGSRKDAGQAFAKSNDGGIDGIIKEDKLGLDIIYVQAKKWSSDRSVSRPEIQKFAGALQGQRAKKGIFITTAKFTQGAIDYTSIIDSKIVLIDGDQLVELMMENDLGVSTVASYHVKKIDTDYFIEE